MMKTTIRKECCYMKIIRNCIAPAVISVVFGLMAGCTPYQPDVQQGQLSTINESANIEIGMTREEVYELMGTPLILDTFNSDRWDYIYTVSQGGAEVEVQAKVTVQFKDDKVVAIAGVPEPEESTEMEPPVEE